MIRFKTKNNEQVDVRCVGIKVSPRKVANIVSYGMLDNATPVKITYADGTTTDGTGILEIELKKVDMTNEFMWFITKHDNERNVIVETYRTHEIDVDLDIIID